MAYGVPPKSTHTLPPGRKAFADSTHTIVSGSKTDVVRPGKWGDGQDRMGTPAGAAHTGAGKQTYLGAAGQKHRQEMRGTGGDAGNASNATVRSKNVKRYGVDGSKLSGATHKSTGESPASQERRGLAPSLPPTTHRERAKLSVRREGWATDGSGRYIPPTHPNTGRHGLDGVHDPHSSTDGAQGMAHLASGGEHGKPSPRRGAVPPRGTRTQDDGALNRASYTGERPSPRRRAK